MAKKTKKKTLWQRRRFLLPLSTVLFVFLLWNLYFSQVSPLYESLLNGDRTAIVEFLKRIKKSPEFSSEVAKYKSIYGGTLEDEVYEEESERRVLIKEFEQKLSLNPKARDVLYNLYVLYKENGNEVKAQEYLKRAQEVDPAVEVKN